MRDLTQGSIPGHIVRMAAPMAIGMLFQTAYYFVDLYFVARLGDTAVAGVGTAGNLQFLIMAVTQVLSVGTMVLISHCAGRKDSEGGTLVYNQSLTLAAITALLTLLLGYTAGFAWVDAISASPETARLGRAYLAWFLPALALQFPLAAMMSTLRATGIARPTMVIQMATVGLNALLAPILITGWGTGYPMGVAGAAFASVVAIVVANGLALVYFSRLEHFVRFDAARLRPHLATWRRMFGIGIPAGLEFGLMFISMAVVYFIIRDFGPAAQAGYGVGSRVMQGVLLPGMAIAFAAAPIAGQNIGANRPDRARETFFAAIKLGSAVMITLSVLCHLRPEWLVHWFSSDPAVLAVAATFLATISINFLASGIVFTCSGLFQALGNTTPTVISSVVRLGCFVPPALWASRQPWFSLQRLWYISVVATTLHAIVAVALLRREATRREAALHTARA